MPNRKVFRESYVFGKDDNCAFLNALIGGCFSSDTRLIADGYYLGAKLLVEQVEKGNPSNVLVYPICYLFRHFIEISLKGIIQGLNQLGYDFKKSQIERTHNLEKLLGITKKLLEEHYDNSFSKEVEKSILNMNSFDPNSQAFRYTTRKGSQFFPDYDVIGLRNLSQKMATVNDELIGALLGLEEEIESEVKDSCI